MSDMKKSPRVSIVTRTKNRPALLGRAIDSALAQTLKSWEMIIVNDGGESAPVDALVKKAAKQAAGRIRVVHNKKSLGMEAASNCALKVARGEFVVIHDDDDSWQPAFLAISRSQAVSPTITACRAWTPSSSKSWSSMPGAGFDGASSIVRVPWNRAPRPVIPSSRSSPTRLFAVATASR